MIRESKSAGRFALAILVVVTGATLCAAEFSFAVLGDIQQKTSVDPDVPECASFVAARDPAFWVPVGDLVDVSEPAYWEAYHTGVQPLASTCDVYPVVGNHDKTGAGGLTLFKEQFPGITWTNGGMCYSFTHEDALFIIMEHGMDLAWLEDLLRNNTKRWVFAFEHNPFYSTGGHGGEDMVPGVNALLEEYSVNAAFTGHTHSYEIVKPINDGQVVDSYADGILYYNTAGIAFASGRADGAASWSDEVAPSQRLVCMVTVSDASVSVDTYDYKTGSVFRTITLPDRSNGSTSVRDRQHVASNGALTVSSTTAADRGAIFDLLGRLPGTDGTRALRPSLILGSEGAALRLNVPTTP